MHKLYKISKIFKKEMLSVSPLHKIYIEQYGNPNGIPVVHLHGGPGSKSSPRYSKFYNPEKYRIVLFDQRGCGKSTPLGEVRENSTYELVSDMEKIRVHLGIHKWMISGGSWGSTLALVYAENYPENVLFLLLRAIFTFKNSEVNWVQKEGASLFFPEEWKNYKNYIPVSEQDDLPKAYAKRLLGKNKKDQNEATRNSDLWAKSILSLSPFKLAGSPSDSEEEIAATKIFYHYEINHGFLEEDQILKNAFRLKDIPGIIIQGRYDMICPPITAWELHCAWPKSKLEFLIGGHYNRSAMALRKFVEYTDKFAEQYYQ